MSANWAPEFEQLATDFTKLIRSDARRARESLAPYQRLTLDGALFEARTVEINGVALRLYFPSTRFRALYESLRLRARLDLPQLDPPEV